MLYSILIYGTEGLVEKLSEEEREDLFGKHRHLQATMREKGKLGPVAQLMPTTTAVTIRGGGGSALVLDGPFTETKEQLLGFYVLECETLEEAIEAAKLLPLDVGTLEVRPVGWFGGEQLKLGE
ncbi:MAG: YciI family protein [Pseudomonadota bacterium]